MLSKSRIKLIKSLASRKIRKREGLFVAEGHRLVGELLSVMQPAYVAATAEWYEQGGAGLSLSGCGTSVDLNGATHCDVISREELSKASLLQTPQDVIAIFPIPHYETTLDACATQALCVALDGIQDPGNLGTIVRLSDWFGVHDIFCSQATADIFNPKAVQATMGALAHVRVHYVDLEAALSSLPGTVPVYGTALEGEPIWSESLTENGVIVMGNEGNGVSAQVRALCSRQLLIPRYPAEALSTESLNVAMATGIVLSEFRRQAYLRAHIII
ncbi:MAG: RNA methyltransferase [Bacteroidaceae bacterium]|nr:RNA methyltransferase [Bacteroidaceae bacterium]